MRRAIMTVAAVVLLVGATEGWAGLVPVNSNSVVQEGIEYYIETNRSVYDLEEDVEILYRVSNLRDESVTFHFSDQVQHYFIVKHDGNLVWDAPKVGQPAGSSFVLPAKGYKEYSETWDMINENGTPWLPEDDFSAIPGSYVITGGFHPIILGDKDKYVPVSVQVEIIPEPTSLLLLGTGLAGLLSRRKR